MEAKGNSDKNTRRDSKNNNSGWKTLECSLVSASRASIAYFTYRITKNILNLKKKKERINCFWKQISTDDNFGDNLTAAILNLRIRVFLCISFFTFLKFTKESERSAHLWKVEAQSELALALERCDDDDAV